MSLVLVRVGLTTVGLELNLVHVVKTFVAATGAIARYWVACNEARPVSGSCVRNSGAAWLRSCSNWFDSKRSFAKQTRSRPRTKRPKWSGTVEGLVGSITAGMGASKVDPTMGNKVNNAGKRDIGPKTSWAAERPRCRGTTGAAPRPTVDSCVAREPRAAARGVASSAGGEGLDEADRPALSSCPHQVRESDPAPFATDDGGYCSGGSTTASGGDAVLWKLPMIKRIHIALFCCSDFLQDAARCPPWSTTALRPLAGVAIGANSRPPRLDHNARLHACTVISAAKPAAVSRP